MSCRVVSCRVVSCNFTPITLTLTPIPTQQVRLALQGVSEWFDDYIAQEESEPAQEPELHKVVVFVFQ